ncbi:PAS domain S-box protein [Proteiniclasticum sp. SCR006]|uniref:PAS domain S-box protein n=1 Tax=Proteiniclasticum aestuarii TaxID=2817862 RepID=A0A939KEL9_9CLOT|nr:PAS domain S-box protein [Proteiniclasticum aestuarii]MBO1263562.1 PAS domain S-box protein [Proteiniclasticum aestuarii]
MNEKLTLWKNDLLDLMNTSSDLIQIVDQDGIIHYANDIWNTALGYGGAEVLFTMISDYLICEDPELFPASGILSVGKHLFQADLRKRNGESLKVEGLIRPLKETRSDAEVLYMCIWKVLKHPQITEKEKPSGSIHPNIIQDDKDEAVQKVRVGNLSEQEKLAGIIEATQAGTWEWDVEKDEIRYNERWAEITGHSLSELMPITHDTWRKLVHPEDLVKSNQEIESIFYKKKEYYSLECRMKHKAGHWVWVLDKGKVVSWSEDGRPLLMFGTHIDITESKQLELEVKKSEDEYRFLVDSSYDIIYRLQLDGTFSFLSKAWENQLGYKVEDTLGTPLKPYVHPEDLLRIYDFFSQINESGEKMETRDYRLLHKNGTYHWFMTTAVAIRSSEDEIIGFTGTAKDITDVKEALIELMNQKEELESFFTVNMDFFCIADSEGNFRKLNDAWSRNFHYKTTELIGKNALEFVHPEDVDGVKEWIRSLNGIKKEASFLARLRKSDGRYRMLEWKAHISGKLIYAAARDVTDNKALESSLFLEKELFRTTLLSVEDGVIATDNTGRITIMNQAAEMMTGWQIKAVQGKPIEEIFRVFQENSNALVYTRIPEIIRKGKRIGFSEMILSSKDGKEIPIENSASAIKDHEGRTTGLVIVFRDMTAKKERQKEIEFLSFHDQLTGLYNRRYIEEALRRLGRVGDLPLSIIVMDINGLKLANDAFGHDLGDLLLKKASRIMKNRIRQDDLLARIGGDEFLLLLPRTDAAEADRIRQRIQEEANHASVGPIRISIAAGAATKTSLSQNISEVQKVADNNMYRDKLVHGRLMKNRIIKTIIESINRKFPDEKIHLKGVAEYCAGIGSAMGLNVSEVERLRLAGSLHDLGKISVPKEILLKPDQLTFEEREVVKKHAETSYQILKSVEEYMSIAEDVLYHHERVDGQGYPEGLKGNEIPLHSRIITVADAYEAMTSDRPYHMKKSKEEAIIELRRCAGSQFDPDIVEIFIEKVLS